MTRPTKIGYAPKNSRLYAGPGVEGGIGYDPGIVTGEVPEAPDLADGAGWFIPVQTLTIIDADDLNLTDGTVTDGGGTKTFTDPTNTNDGAVGTHALRNSFAGGVGQTSILETDLGAPFEVAEVLIVGGTGAVASNTTAMLWTLEESDDGSSWTPAPITQVNGFVSGTRATSTLTLDTPTTARYWRIIHTTNYSGFHSNLFVSTWSISGDGLVLGNVDWAPAPTVNDGDDATFEYVLEDAILEAGDEFLRTTLSVPWVLTGLVIRVGMEDAGSATITVEGAEQSDYSDAIEIGAATFTGTGSYTAQDVPITLDGLAGYTHLRFLLTVAQGIRVHEVELTGLSSSAGVTDHPSLTDRDLADQHPADAVSYDPTTSGLTATDVQAAIDELAAAPGGGADVELVEVAAAGSTETVDVSVARTYDLTLTADLTLALSGAVNNEAHYVTIAFRQDGTGGWEVTHPGSVVWADGAPTIDPDPTAVTWVTYLTLDGGTVWYGFPIGGSGGGGGTPSASVVSETVFDLAPAAGASTDYSRGDHTHGTPATPISTLIPVDTGTPTYDDTDPDFVEVTVATVWGIGTDPYYDAGGAVAGEEAALYWDPVNLTYILVPFNF
jgi:hypothetical protein